MDDNNKIHYLTTHKNTTTTPKLADTIANQMTFVEDLNDSTVLYNANRITVVIMYMELVLSFFLNSLSIIGILYSRRFSRRNLLIVNLSLAELVLATGIPLKVRQFMAEADESESYFSCQYGAFIEYASKIPIVYSIAALTINRYIILENRSIKWTNARHSASTHLYYKERMKLLMTLSFLALLWLMSFVVASPFVYVLSWESNQTNCYADKLKISVIIKFEYLEVIYKIVAFVVPYIVTIVFSILILRIIRKWYRRTKHLTNINYVRAKSGGSHKAGRFNKSIADDATTHHTINIEQDATSTLLSPSVIEHPQQHPALKTSRSASDFVGMIAMSRMSLNQMQNIGGSSSTKVKNLRVVAGSSSVGPKVPRAAHLKKRSTDFVLAVVISFLIISTSIWIFNLIEHFKLKVKSQYFIFIFLMDNITTVLLYSGGIINPLLFMILTENFRRNFVLALVNDFKATRLGKLCYSHNNNL